MALLVERYLSNAASFVLCVLRSAKDHYILLEHSTCLKKACVRQVALYKRFPLRLVALQWPLPVVLLPAFPAFN